MSLVIAALLAAILTATAGRAPEPALGAALRGVDDAAIGSGIGQFLYAGGWQHVRGATDGRYGGTSSRSDDIGAHVEFRFIGANARLYAVRGPAGGIGLVSVDGRDAIPVNFYAPRIRPHVLVYAADGLAKRALHVLVVVVSGERPATSFGHFVNIDEIAVDRSARLAVLPRPVPRVAGASVAPWPLGDVVAAAAAAAACLAAALVFAVWRRSTGQRTSGASSPPRAEKGA